MTEPSLLGSAAVVAGPLANGIALPLIGFWAWRRCRDDAAGLALFCAALPAGVLLLTAVDLDAWTALTRLFLLAAALLPAGLLQLALTFPVDRLRRHRAAALLALYLPSLALALVSQLTLADQLARRSVDALLGGATLVAGTALLVGLLAAATRAPTLLARRRAALALVGGLGAALPGLVLVLGRHAPDDWMSTHGAALTLWNFPIAVAAAVTANGLVAIDHILRRTLSAALLTATVGATFAISQVAASALDPTTAVPTASPAGVALLNLCVVFLIVPMRAGAQALVDRLFAPAGFDGERLLADLARGLSAARTIGALVAHAGEVLGAHLRPGWLRLYLPDGGGQFHLAGGGRGPRSIVVPDAWWSRLDRGEVVAADELPANDADRPAAGWGADAGLVIPLRADRSLLGLLVLGPRPRPYGPRELLALRSAAYQLALGLLGTRAVEQLDVANRRLGELNLALEQQVAERTAALHASNDELRASMARLRATYQQLTDRHAGLLRAERLATLGRLSASMAHEINTPLSAVMNALKTVGDLAREYEDSIDDPQVLPADHREIAAEIVAATSAASEWAGKAAAHIRRIKSHGREAGAGDRQSFAIRAAVDEARGLIAHRLHLAGCALEFWEESPGLSLTGDRGQFGQVLVNLFNNAVDAYEERGRRDGRILVRAARAGADGMRLTVTDWAGGIAPAILPHIFNDLYTTKEDGRGTGLGLWIARTQIEQDFGGTLDVLSGNGSSCFSIELPSATSPPAAAPSLYAGSLAAAAAP